MVVVIANFAMKMGRKTSSTIDPKSHLSEAVYALRRFTGSFSIRAPGGSIDGSSMTQATLSRPFLFRISAK